MKKVRKILSVSVSFLLLAQGSHAFQGQAYLSYLKGLIYMQSGQLGGAITEFKRVVQTDPDAVPVYKDLAYAYWQSGERTKAIEAANKLKELYSDNLYTQLFLGSFYMTAGQAQDASTAWKNALKIDPNNETAILYLAAYYSASNNPKEAVAYWDKYIRQKPESAESYYQRGIAFEKLGQLEKATQSLEKTVILRPDSYEAYFALAQLYEKQERLGDAILECEKYLAHDPDNVMILLYAGGLYYRTKNYASSEKMFRKADKVHPDDPTIIFWLGVLAEERKDWAEAIYNFESLREKEETPMLLARLSYYYSLNSQTAKAIRYIKKAIELDPRNPNLYYLLGLSYDDMKKYDLAEKSFQSALEIKPDFVDVYYHRAIMYDKQKKFDEAVPDLEKAIELDPKYSRALNYLGYSYAEKNIELAKAEELVKRALALEPENPAYLDSLGWIYFRQDKFEEADRYIDKAAEKMDDAVIYEHQGDIKLKLNKKIQAWAAYENALHISPKNKTLTDKLIELEKGLSETEIARAQLERIVRKYEKARSFRSDFFIKGEEDSYNFFFSGNIKYLEPKQWRVDLQSGLLNPELSAYYGPKIMIQPRALESYIPDEVKDFFERESPSLGEFLNDGVRIKIEKKFFVYETGKKTFKIRKKTTLPESLAVENGLVLYFSDFASKDSLAIPQKVEFVIKGKLRGKIVLENIEINNITDKSLLKQEAVPSK